MWTEAKRTIRMVANCKKKSNKKRRGDRLIEKEMKTKRKECMSGFVYDLQKGKKSHVYTQKH